MVYYIMGGLHVLTDASGAEVQRATYVPFGEARTQTGTLSLAWHRCT